MRASDFPRSLASSFFLFANWEEGSEQDVPSLRP
jgi:hypothetical protein